MLANLVKMANLAKVAILAKFGQGCCQIVESELLRLLTKCKGLFYELSRWSRIIGKKHPVS